MRKHIPFGVTGCFYGLGQYRIISAPLLSSLEEKDNTRLIDYVAQGGTLYLSGCGNMALVERLTGNRFVRMTEEENLYLAPAEGFESVFCGFNGRYPLPFEQTAPVVTPGDVQVIATLTFPYTKPNDIRYASIHSNPPGIPSGIPAVTVNTFGKGKVIWSAFPIENMQYEEYRSSFLNLLHIDTKPDYFFSSDAPANVEITAFKNTDSVTVNTVVLDEEAISTPVDPFLVKVRICARSVKRLPDGEPIPFEVKDGCTIFKTQKLHIFDMYEITE